MPRLAAILACSAAATLLAACVSNGSMDAGYEASLAKWKGAPRVLLESSWGRPNLEEQLPGSAVLVYVVHHDFENRSAPSGQVVIGAGTTGATVVDAGRPLAPALPVTCTTRFVLKGGLVESWSFSGIGCGAPRQ